MENNPKINLMGSEVVEGYACKPKKLDPNKPIMHYESHIFVCNGDRCAKAFKGDKAVELRDIIKQMQLDRGKKRIKVTRSGCYGACRFRGVINIYENTASNGFVENNNIWLKHTHLYSKEKWQKLFNLLSQNIAISKSEDFEIIEEKEY